MIDEIEGHTITPDEIIMSSKCTLDQEQIYVDSVRKTGFLRGCTEIKLYKASKFIFPKSENKIMRIIIFRVQTAKQYQSVWHKYQGDMKDNPKLGITRKRRKQSRKTYQK